MSIVLPDASTADADSLAAQAAAIATAEVEFIADATVLILEAINLGFFEVQPFLPPLVPSSYVVTYFTALGYSVLFPIIPPGPFQNLVVQPQVIPPGYTRNAFPQAGPPRIQISWGP